MRFYTPLLLAAPAIVSGLNIKVDDAESIKSAARTIGYGMMSYYSNNKTDTDPHLVGCFPYPPYYWWESGAVWGSMIDYAQYTKDTSYNEATIQGITANGGANSDFILPWHAFDSGNDDIAFWALGVMSALELEFPNPSADKPQWLTLAENTFNSMVPRWDMGTCNGGLRWQVYAANKGWDYKNSISNGGFFQLAARLARYTGNQTYADWAEKIWDWSAGVGLIGSNFEIYDGSDSTINCTGINHIEWSYNNAIYILGAASLANATKSQTWIDRTNGLLGAASRFFSPFDNSTNVMFEPACETVHTCNVDQFSFKAYLSRWLAKTAIVFPSSKDTITTWLTASAQAAVNSCVDNGKGSVDCGSRWYTGGYDGVTGLGQQLAAFETVISLLAVQGGAPVVKAQADAAAAAAAPASRSSTSVLPSAIPSPASASAPAPSVSAADKSSAPAPVVTTSTSATASAAPVSAADMQTVSSVTSVAAATPVVKSPLESAAKVLLPWMKIG